MEEDSFLWVYAIDMGFGLAKMLIYSHLFYDTGCR